MLHINNKDYSEERSNQKPLSLNEQYEVLNDIRCIIEEHTYFRSKEGIKPAETKRIQSLLYHYQNLQEEVNRLRDKANAYDKMREALTEITQQFKKVEPLYINDKEIIKKAEQALK